MPEAFQPIAVQPPSENRFKFWLRCLVDLQLLTIFRFLRPILSSCRGQVLDVGAGEAPWRDLLPIGNGAEYFGVDVNSSDEFGMRRQQGITYYDGIKLPYRDGSFDYVLCVEVLEHVADPASFLLDLQRVLKPGGTLILTIPWSARVHHVPHDYTRFTRFGLSRILKLTGFSSVLIAERGNNIAVIANKLIVLTFRLLHSRRWRQAIWAWPLAVLLAPFTILFLGGAHFSMRWGNGTVEDPLGYGVTAVKC